MTEKSEITMNTTEASAAAAAANTEAAAATETTYGGFKTVEELVAAHAELTAKQTATPTAEEAAAAAAANTETKPALEIPAGDEGAQKVVESAGLDWAGLNTEYAEKGKLSDETYASLEKAGIPKAEVDTYIRGKQAEVDAYDAAVYGTAGGNEQYMSLLGWAKENYAESEKVEFNAAVTSGNPARAKMAVEALAARHAAKRGAPPGSLLTGKKAPTGAAPFKSQVEVTAAMRTPQYKNDPAFRAEVMERLRLSEF
jgi:Phage T7 capsid assembly protein